MNYTQEQKDAWEQVCKHLQDNLSRVSYEQWIRPLELYSVTQDSLIITGRDSFNINHVKNRYFTDLYNLVSICFGRSYELEFHTKDEMQRQMDAVSRTMLNPKYTFDNFVVGNSNNFAYAASLAVAEDPSNAYNPLFIYGSVGLGKTHLMNAIGNYVMSEDPMKNVLLTTSESFTNELIDAIVSKKGTAALRSKMRNVDVLMVDDIQFLSRTKTTQEEFFHTFNDLHSRGKQIIISSDRPPKDIPTLEERLRSRFEWGLIVDIQKPEFETRVAILRRKAQDDGIDVPADVIDYIAEHVESNIRELEGTLTRLNAQYSHHAGCGAGFAAAAGKNAGCAADYAGIDRAGDLRTVRRIQRRYAVEEAQPRYRAAAADCHLSLSGDDAVIHNEHRRGVRRARSYHGNARMR